MSLEDLKREIKTLGMVSQELFLTFTDEQKGFYYDIVCPNIGFSGKGPSALDKKVRVLTDGERKEFKDIIEVESTRRWKIFRLSCIETLGEDPETDWI